MEQIKHVTYINVIYIVRCIEPCDRNYKLSADKIGEGRDRSLSTILSFHLCAVTEQFQCWIL